MSEPGWMPRIVRSLCDGCGACIRECPTGALGWKDGRADLLFPDKCIYCAHCEAICPTFAIELPYLVIRPETPSQEKK
ncbi:MAG: 4Fe-4S binding protein [Pleurocapsa minor GSE-CHR-MK-17-07R]|nr:4Fe-4S binding protein [Pleurocapsa minor GSE-CHR-MK 17-07R]